MTTVAGIINVAKQFDAVCWDHDGVLVDTEDLFFEATREAFERAGIFLSCEVWCAEYLGKGMGTASIAMAHGLNHSQAEELVLNRNERYQAKLASSPAIRINVEETLRGVAGKVSLALVTGSTREQLKLVHRERSILDCFSVIVSREDYSKAKPDPEPYLKAAATLGVRPERCLAVEDSARGLASAIAAGMKCVVVPTRLTTNQDFSLAFAVETTVCAVPAHVFPCS